MMQESFCDGIRIGVNSDAGPLSTLADLVTAEGFVVPDGTWCDRFMNARLLEEATAAECAREAILDRDHREVLYPMGVLIALNLVPGIPAAARAAALREVWLDYGIHADTPDDVATLFRAVHTEGAEAALMNPDEIAHLRALPTHIWIHRGQMFTDGPHRVTNVSWTLSKKVADWYAGADGYPPGWVLSVRVPSDGVLALFLERGELEVVVDPRTFCGRPIRVQRGTCKTFPRHLSHARAAGGPK